MASANYPLILTEGGDDRLVLNAKGVNKYHCRPEVSLLSVGVGSAFREHSDGKLSGGGWVGVQRYSAVFRLRQIPS